MVMHRYTLYSTAIYSPFVVVTNLDAAPWSVSVELTLGHLGEHFVHGVPGHVVVLVDKWMYVVNV